MMPCSHGLSPLIFTPLFKEKVWGGQALRLKLEKNIPPNVSIGESWEISAVPGSESMACSGPWAGKTLPDICTKEPAGLLGANTDAGYFPLLYKFIDAQQKLSIQVHPDDQQARKRSMGTNGKTECWYVVDAKPGVQLVCGFKNNVTKKDVQEAVCTGQLPSLCNYISIKPGDVVFVPAGTIHATLANTLLYEVEQSSDATFRFFDWERPGGGAASRPLHVQEGLSVLDTDHHDQHLIEPVTVPEEQGIQHTVRVACRYFMLEEYLFPQASEQVLPARRSFQVITVLKGSMTIAESLGTQRFSKGASVLIPASCGPCRIAAEAKTRMLVSCVPNLEAEVVDPLARLGVSAEAIGRLGGNPSRNHLSPILKSFFHAPV